MEPLDPRRFRPPPSLTGPEVAARADVDYDYALRIWRALGFPHVPEDAVEFDEQDVEVLTGLGAILSQGFDPGEILAIARTYGFGLSRMADAEVRLFRKTVVDPARRGGSEDEAIEHLATLVPPLLDLLGALVDHVHRRHLAVALQQLTAREGDATENLAVGFVDLVGFTRIVRDIAGDRLEDLVGRFETIALESCVDHGSQVVKMIGDAVMFVAPAPGPAIRTAMAILDAAASAEDIPLARGGLDYGPLVAVGGDFFGPPVNVAARLAAFARRGTIVASPGLVDAVDEPIDVSRIAPTRLRGVGTITPFKINAYPARDGR